MVFIKEREKNYLTNLFGGSLYRVEESPLFQRLFDVQLPPQILFASQTLLAQPHVQNDLAAEF